MNMPLKSWLGNVLLAPKRGEADASTHTKLQQRSDEARRKERTWAVAKESNANDGTQREKLYSSSPRESGTSSARDAKLRSQDAQAVGGQKEKSRHRSFLASSRRSDRQDPHTRTSFVRSQALHDELRNEWPTEGGEGEPPSYPSSSVSEHALDNSDRCGKMEGLGGMMNSISALELADREGLGPQRERSQRRHSSSLMQALGDDPQALGGYRPQRRQSKASASRHNDTAPTRRKGRTKRKPKRNVTFCDMQSMCTYESATSFMPIGDLFYSREDDATFSDLTVAHARSIRSYIKAFARDETSFNALTGLPSPEALQRNFLGPEDIVGIEHLLCGRGVARSQLQLKTNHAKVLLDTQQRGMDANALSKELRKYSIISSKLAACRASYATMF